MTTKFSYRELPAVADRFRLERWSYDTREMESLMQRASIYDLVLATEVRSLDLLAVADRLLDFMADNELQCWRVIGLASLILLAVANAT